MASETLKLSRSLEKSIANEKDARSRMQYCRRAIALGRSAVREADALSDRDIEEIQNTLRFAHRVSLGMYNPNASITKLAKYRMERLGLQALPIIGVTKPKNVGTDVACLALSDDNLPDSWFDTATALQAINAEQYGLVGVGADGIYSVCLRHIDAKDHFLEPAEYKNIVEVLPPFAVQVTSGALCFGPAENLRSGATLPVPNGRYVCSLATIRSGRRLRFLATVFEGDMSVPAAHQLLEFREL